MRRNGDTPRIIPPCLPYCTLYLPQPRLELRSGKRGNASTILFGEKERVGASSQDLLVDMEKTLEVWAQKIGDRSRRGIPRLRKLGKTWLQRFLNRRPSMFGSNVDRHRAF